MGVVKYFLGLDIAHSLDEMSVSQKKYIMDLISDADLENCKPARTVLQLECRLIIMQIKSLIDLCIEESLGDFCIWTLQELTSLSLLVTDGFRA